jgi:hypothetical protein
MIEEVCRITVTSGRGCRISEYTRYRIEEVYRITVTSGRGCRISEYRSEEVY